MSGEAEKLLSEIRDCCVEMLALTKAEAEKQAEVREQYADAVAMQRRYLRTVFAVVFVVVLAGAAVVAYVL